MADHLFDLEAPNVANEVFFKDLLGRGYRVEVLCLQDAWLRGQVWCGVWYLRVVSPDRKVEKILSTTRVKKQDIGFSLREFKTTNGLVSYLYTLGYREVSFSLTSGGVTNLGPVSSSEDSA